VNSYCRFFSFKTVFIQSQFLIKYAQSNFPQYFVAVPLKSLAHPLPLIVTTEQFIKIEHSCLALATDLMQ